MYKSAEIFFGNIGVKYFLNYFEPIREHLIKSNMNILFEIYIGRMIFYSLLSFLFVFFSVFGAFLFFSSGIIFSLISGLLVSVISFFVIITLFHAYPVHLINTKKTSIDSIMPFAINHMSAISSSGVPPFVIFNLLSKIPEYGEIANESRRIVRNYNVFGMDIITSVRNVASRTPSDEFRKFLFGFISSTETGGDLRKYLSASAKEAMFDYRLKREKYLQTLAAYADFYTAVLIAAPLFFISVLSVMSLLGGQVMGLDIPTIMRLGIYVLIPIMNTMFIAFINFTQPSL